LIDCRQIAAYSRGQIGLQKLWVAVLHSMSDIFSHSHGHMGKYGGHMRISRLFALSDIWENMTDIWENMPNIWQPLNFVEHMGKYAGHMGIFGPLH
jgi:hypothetical protein